jgi:hypothetical protein
MSEHKIKEAAERQGDDVAELIAKHLAEAMPVIPAEARLPLAVEMIGLVGRMVEFWEKNGPMTIPKAAAFMFFVEQLQIDKTTEANARLMLELLAGARKARDELTGKDGN